MKTTFIMRNNIRVIATAILICITSISGVSQVTNQDEDLMRRAAERVKLMNDYIGFMCNKKKSIDTRKGYKGKALPLFIGKGYEYEENGIRKEGVQMQTTSRNTNSTNKSLMRNYFDRLINLNYSEIVTTSTEIPYMKVSNLKKVDDNLYVCTVQYVQYFYGYRDGELKYSDRTTKRIICYVESEDTEDGTEYIIRLGDVEALATERI